MSQRNQKRLVKWLGIAMIAASGIALSIWYDSGAWLLAGLAMTGGVLYATAAD